MQIWSLSNGSYSLKNCHNPFGKANQPPPTAKILTWGFPYDWYQNEDYDEDDETSNTGEQIYGLFKSNISIFMGCSSPIFLYCLNTT